MNEQLLVMLCIAAAVSLVAFALATVLLNRGGDEKKLRGRLQKNDGAAAGPDAAGQAAKGGLKPLLAKMGQAAAEPFMPKTREKQSTLRQNLARAGIYAPSAVKVL